MSQEYDNTNKGALFANDRRESEKHPTHKGTLNVGGREYWLSAWVAESKKDGRKYFRLSVQPKEERPERQRREDPPPKQDEFDSDIPF